MKSTPGKSRRPVKVRKATTKTKAKAAKLRAPKVTKQRARKAAKKRVLKVAKKPGPARKQAAELKVARPPKDDSTSKMIRRDPAHEVERQQESHQQELAT